MREVYRIGLRFLPSLKRLVDTVYSNKARIQQLKNELEKLKAEVEGMKIEKVTGYAPAFNTQKRYLTYEELQEFGRKWLPRFGYPCDDEQLRMLGYMAHRICSVESMCVGRIAGNSRQILLRTLTARSIERGNLEILEIGTLFGSGIASIYDNCLGSFNNIHITVIDPLDGFYSQQQDYFSRMPVTIDIFKQNMQRVAIPETDYTIIQRLSMDPDAIRRASAKKYDLLIIDGDHSYEGVKNDYLNYRPFVRLGGYIYLDDYAKHFPGIIKFIDEEIKGSLDLLQVGLGDGVAIFKVLK